MSHMKLSAEEKQQLKEKLVREFKEKVVNVFEDKPKPPVVFFETKTNEINIKDEFYKMVLGLPAKATTDFKARMSGWLSRFGLDSVPWTSHFTTETGEGEDEHGVNVNLVTEKLMSLFPTVKLVHTKTGGLQTGFIINGVAIGMHYVIGSSVKTRHRIESAFPEFHALFKFLVEETYPPLSGHDITRLITVSENINTQSEYITKEKHVIRPDIMYPNQPLPSVMWDEFSKANGRVLLMKGTYGTGKSNYIQDMMEYRGWKNVYIADNESVFDRPDFIDFVRENLIDKSVLVIEDGDRLLTSREGGNSQMSALLNAVSGIVTKDIRIIITVNLKNLNGVDGALMRGGRLFRLMEFTELSLSEAQELRTHLGGSPNDLTEDRTYTAGDVINWDENHVPAEGHKQTWGFNQA